MGLPPGKLPRGSGSIVLWFIAGSGTEISVASEQRRAAARIFPLHRVYALLRVWYPGVLRCLPHVFLGVLLPTICASRQFGTETGSAARQQSLNERLYVRDYRNRRQAISRGSG
jgi:hypothetical protein